MTNLNQLERSVIELLLSVTTKRADALRRQLGGLSVIGRELTGAGFVTKLMPADGAVPLSVRRSFHLSNVGGRHVQSPSGLTFTLFVKDGYLDVLEGASCDGVWPQSPEQISLYRGQLSGDLKELDDS